MRTAGPLGPAVSFQVVLFRGRRRGIAPTAHAVGEQLVDSRAGFVAGHHGIEGTGAGQAVVAENPIAPAVALDLGLGEAAAVALVGQRAGFVRVGLLPARRRRIFRRARGENEPGGRRQSCAPEFLSAVDDKTISVVSS